MPHTSKLEEASKIVREAKFATLGRAIADAPENSDQLAWAINEATLRRSQEQANSDKLIEFAALARQIGDAHRQHKDLALLIQQIRELRRQELGPAVEAESAGQ